MDEEIVDDLPIEEESMEEFIALVEDDPTQDVVVDEDGNVLHVDGTDEPNDGDMDVDGGTDEPEPVDDGEEGPPPPEDEDVDNDPLVIIIEE